MILRIAQRSRGLVFAVGMAWCAAPAAWAKETFTLASAVPDNVFFYVGAHHNPEREFLEGYWNEVFDALCASGIGNDVMELIGSFMGEQERAEVDRLKTLATNLVAGVDWKQLGGGEFVYAMRMPQANQSAQNFNVGPPEMLWMFRGATGSAAKNYEGLTAMLDTLAAEINKLAKGEVVKIERTTQGSAKVAQLMAPIGMQGMVRFVALALHGDTIVMTMGEALLPEILNLLESKGATNRLSENARFKSAMAGLPPAEDSMVFFDMRGFVGSLRTLAEGGFKFGRRMQSSNITNARINPESNALNAQAMEAYNKKDYKKALEFVNQAYKISPTDSVLLYNLACFNALAGNRDEALNWLEKAVDAGFHDADAISSDEDLVSLQSDGRFQAAIAKAKAGSPDTGDDADAQLDMFEKLVGRLLDVPGMIDYVAAVEYTDGFTTHADSIAALSPDAAKTPFYGVCCKRPPLTSYERYLPQETVSFSVSNGLDLIQLYTFVEETIRSLGPLGDQVLTNWAEIQKQIGLNVRQDVLSWIEGQIVKVDLQRESGAATVIMFRVTDEAKAREQLAAALTFLSTKLQELATQQPMLAMMAIRTSPTTNEKLTGFQNIYFSMSPQPFVCGVKDGYLILGSTEDAVATCLATSTGEHPNVTQNKGVMAEAVLPKGSFCAVSLTDQRQSGQELAQVLGGISMMGTMATMAIPDPQAQQVVSKIMGMLGKLAPVAQKIDFFKSSASCTDFDGKVWQTRAVVHYRSPAERTPVKTAAP